MDLNVEWMVSPWKSPSVSAIIFSILRANCEFYEKNPNLNLEQKAFLNAFLDLKKARSDGKCGKSTNWAPCPLGMNFIEHTHPF